MNNKFADALHTMCSQCEEIALGIILRNIRERRGFSVRGFAEYINQMDEKYQELFGTSFSLGRIDRNMVHRWEGTESNEPSIAKTFSKKHLFWLGTILELDIVERATYDLAVICYLMFELNEQSREICDELETQDKVFAENGELAVMAKNDKETMPQQFKQAGLNENDIELWNAASAYLSNPSDETLQAYLEARQQMASFYFAREDSDPIAQKPKLAFDAVASTGKSKQKNSPALMTKSYKFIAGIAAIIGIIAFAGGFVLSNYLQDSGINGLIKPSETFTPTPVFTVTPIDFDPASMASPTLIPSLTPTPIASTIATATPFFSPTPIPTVTAMPTATETS